MDLGAEVSVGLDFLFAFEFSVDLTKYFLHPHARTHNHLFINIYTYCLD